MRTHSLKAPAETVTSTVLDLVLLCLMIGSGCAALIYQVVWLQFLELIIGSSGISLGVLLGTFMGGMFLGSLALPRLVSPARHPLAVYALIEFGIGGIGVALVLAMPIIAQLYAAIAPGGFAGLLLRGLLSGVLLLPPTILMGATLPAIARWMDTTAQGMSRLGVLYAGNIAGAVFGSLIAGFFLLRLYDMVVASFVAAAINGAIAVISVLLAVTISYRAQAGAETPASQPAMRTPRLWAVYVTIGLSGLTALGAEVIWTRLLSYLFGTTVYTFAIILAVFLFGLGIGSGAGAYLVRTIREPRLALAVCQILLVLAIAWSAYLIGSAIPYWPIAPQLVRSPWFVFQLDLVRSAVPILPAALLWGASFPFALAAVAVRGGDAGRATGVVYAANTLGAVVGALGFGMFIIPFFGTQQAQQLLVGLATMAGLLMLGSLAWSRRQDSPNDIPRGRTKTVIGAAATVAAAALLIVHLPDVPAKLIAYGRDLLVEKSMPKFLYRGDGRVSSVVVSEYQGIRRVHVSGKVVASNGKDDMRLQRMLGHIPALLHPNPRSVLIVGFGAGVTAGTFVLYPSIERIVICEIEPIIPPNVGPYFAKENYNVLKDPRVEVVYDDARHYILTAKEKFDIVTSDPIHPYVKGAASLYTREYFEHVKRRLNPGGVVTQWVPLYESTPDVVRSEVATFFGGFPGGIVFGNTSLGVGYDVVLFGQLTPRPIDIDELKKRLARADHRRVAASLSDVGLNSAIDLLATYAGQQQGLEQWLAGAAINTDRNLRLQYIAGMGLHFDARAQIYRDIFRYRRFPGGLVVGSEDSLRALSWALIAPTSQ